MDSSHAEGFDKIRLLFVCTYNSGRSQMAEAYTHAMASDRFIAESAGFMPRDVDVLVLEVMKADGIDLPGKKSGNIRLYWEEQRYYDYIINVGEQALIKKIPPFPGNPRQLFWPFPDHRRFDGSRYERLQKLRNMRDRMKSQISAWTQAVGRAWAPAEKVIPFHPLSAASAREKLTPLR